MDSSLVLTMSMAAPTPSSMPPPPRHNIVFTLPRTSSNLLTQILNLSAQLNIHRHPSDGYIFLPPLVHRFKNDLAGKDVNLWTEEEWHGMRDAFQRAYEELEKLIGEADVNGKGIYIKEHINWLVEPGRETQFLWPGQSNAWNDTFTITPAKTNTPASASLSKHRSTTNETCLPDSILSRLSPTILIRNPLLTLPSLLRTIIDNEGLDIALATPTSQWLWESSFHWSRSLYDFYTTTIPASARATNTPGIAYPIVLDADDLSNPDLVRRYTQAVQLDPELVRFEWEAAGREELEGVGPNVRRMKDTLLASTGIVKGKTAVGVSAEREIGKWKEEFGEVLAGRLVGLLEGVRGDYEELWGRRFR
ncbi:hypothetical protein K505DRAFT_376679 [Melanomma pulvis-pyrius CBS 109.77]|uniref:Uncharacterized protein n=1 Tax=Melanomma pulvis-pyrius CBS 109.77 TaxID=1314802 RepID=A0A6A6X607_9PLEO|nr:hypothetical protein K505DRAFT_376679 [Melanomma pulvis-pyrius CBS 109.77]